MKKALIIRLGAYGDMIMITPVIQKLKDMGYYIILNTGFRGIEVFKHDNRIDEFIEHENEIALDKVGEHWDNLKKKVNPDIFINFSESIECNVALHPKNPMYIYPKKDRAIECNKNYYDVTIDWAKDRIGDFGRELSDCHKLPSLQFTEQEHQKVQVYPKDRKFNILWALSGSGKNKVYPWTDFVIGETLKKFDKVHFITVGDEKCQILEDINKEFPKENITQLAGRIPMRESMLLTKYVDLVITPDTALLHAAGCFDTPKIGLLGHTTKENVTKYFINDYSIESQCECAPCFRLIYDWKLQCPLDPITKAAWCMSKIKPQTVFNRIKEVRDAGRK